MTEHLISRISLYALAGCPAFQIRCRSKNVSSEVPEVLWDLLVRACEAEYNSNPWDTLNPLTVRDIFSELSDDEFQIVSGQFREPQYTIECCENELEVDSCIFSYLSLPQSEREAALPALLEWLTRPLQKDAILESEEYTRYVSPLLQND